MTCHPVCSYLGAFYAVGAVGPALGFVLGGMTLSTFVDPGENTNDLTPEVGLPTAALRLLLFGATYCVRFPDKCRTPPGWAPGGSCS